MNREDIKTLIAENGAPFTFRLKDGRQVVVSDADDIIFPPPLSYCIFWDPNRSPRLRRLDYEKIDAMEFGKTPKPQTAESNAG